MYTNGLKKNKLAMVDLDDTLIFTTKANHMAYKEALNEHGFDLSLEYYAEKCNGRKYRDFLPEIMGTGHPAIETVHDRKIELYAECLKCSELNGPLVDILRSLKADYYIALVTTATRANVERILEHFELSALFDMLLTQEDVEKTKPDPTCYNTVIEKFGVSREDCIIFEDSSTGIAAALASGCQTMCIKRGGHS